jgi:hypothetical protein
MIKRQGERRRHDVITIPVIWLALVLSLAVHVAALWSLLPALRLTTDAVPTGEDTRPPMTARLEGRLAQAPESRPPADPPAARLPEALPPQRVPTPRPAPKRAPTPPSTAPVLRPSPAAVAPVPESPLAIAPPVPQAPSAPDIPAPQSAPAPPAADLSAYIAAQRRARGETDASASQGATPIAPESETARRDRIVAQNLASVNARDFGSGSNSGGIFQITRLGYADAEFTFFGWNRDIHRRASQRIDVRRGDNPDIRIAVVREMIAIIRRYENEDFVWESRRLGRRVTLSARTGDTRALESFMIREFFDDVVARP